MKQRITQNDLKSLTDEQRRSLVEFWTPSAYDVVVAKVLKNVATEEYVEYEFVIGGISIHGTDIYLTDIAAGRTGLQSQSDAEDSENGKNKVLVEEPMLTVKVDSVFGEGYPSFGNRDDLNRAAEGMEEAIDDEFGEKEEVQKDDFEEEDLEDNFQPPTTYIKDDCTPLLTIGNMIEILQKNNYGKFDFFVSVTTYEKGCELSRDDSSWGNYTDWEPAELCDVLWDSVKELLYYIKYHILL